MEDRVEELECRIAHQEAAIEELTRAQVASEARVRDLETRLQQLLEYLRGLHEQLGEQEIIDAPPPHY